MSIKWCQHRASRKEWYMWRNYVFVKNTVYPILLCSNPIVSCVYMYFILTFVNPLLSWVNFVLSLRFFLFFFLNNVAGTVHVYMVMYVCICFIVNVTAFKNTKILSGCQVKMLVNISYTNDAWEHDQDCIFSVYHLVRHFHYSGNQRV